MSTGYVNEKEVYEKGVDSAVSVREVDTAAELLGGVQGELDPVEALRVRYAVGYTSCYPRLKANFADERSIFTSSHSCVVRILSSSFRECMKLSAACDSVLYW